MASYTDIIGSHEKVLVDFSATWCGPCKMLGPILEDLKAKAGDEVKIVKIDVDRNPELASRYQVQGVPTLILYRNGNQVWRQSGVLSAHDLLNVIRSH